MNSLFESLCFYNAKDAANTLGLWDALRAYDDPQSEAAYEMLRALQAPALAMNMRGILINQLAAHDAAQTLAREMAKLLGSFHFVSEALTGVAVNLNSPKQKGEFFKRLGVEPVTLTFKGVRRETWGREALETIRDRDPDVAPLIDILLEYTDRKMLHQVLSKPLRNGRFFSSFNIAGTDTFRWSSSESAFWDGGNLQNITEPLRYVFIADPGYKLLNVDLSTGDSRMVALDIFARLGDDRYLAACSGGDLHTGVARMVWPDLEWPDDPRAARKLAEQPYYRHYDRRFMCKKLGHGRNYYGQAFNLSRQAKVDRLAVEHFIRAYDSAFGTPEWHRAVINDLQTNSCLTNIFGIRRWFHGRLSQDSTIRKAIAYLGQSGTAICINNATIRAFTEVELPFGAQLLAQVHDSLLIQYPEVDEAWIVPLILECFNNPITVSHGAQRRSHTVPIDAAIGWNWGKSPDEKSIAKGQKPNPDGLVGWKGPKEDTRKRRYDPAAGLLDRHI